MTTASAAPAPALRFSFEFFPPKDEAAEVELRHVAKRLAVLEPEFLSVTYGAGGGTRTRTRATVETLQAETGVPVAAHLTCVGATKAQIHAVADEYWQAGIRHIVALRGDPPDFNKMPPDSPGRVYTPHPDGYAYAVDLVAGLSRLVPFDFSVAAYPETHPEAVSPEQDLDNLKRKFEAGANRALTQFFFDPSVFEAFLERAAKIGITAPIIPGLLPITHFARTRQFAAQCGASIPPYLAQRFEGLDDDPTRRQEVALQVCLEQARALMKLGIRQFHIYTLNRADLTLRLCQELRG
ncbi:MAG: methylenetetrahydrofolate reductase [NAD(P)H] [Alphaproteobacteria bacterium]|nr:MAG: methylenetetrahydrofolate reductase [NAD(P)H] [Alphaproteobacteria bacterium]